MKETYKYSILAFYWFTFIENPQEEVKKHHDFFRNKDIKSRIYISSRGINAQMSAEKSTALEYMDWLKRDERFKCIDFKIHEYHEHVFPRATVKVRDQLVALDEEADPEYGGEHISPSAWKKMLQEKDENTLLLDVRNDYEWKIGHFEGAIKPDLEMFRKFPAFAEKLKNSFSPKETKVMMYCTGGIRCELYSSLLKKHGFKNVYQLDGGVIKYGLEEGNDHWKGRLFVFDDRLAVPISPENPSDEVISHCQYCSQPSDAYYNCANMDCNELFICCPNCGEKWKGCCKQECLSSPRLRPYQKTERPKPFRKWYHYDEIES